MRLAPQQRWLLGMDGLTARCIHLTRSDTREPYTGSLATPDRAIAVPDPNWGTLKGLPRWNNLCRGKKKEHAKYIMGALRIRRNDIWRSCANI